jgi:aerobic carbon-monoxide dehydrogenase large subunit
MSHDVIYDDMSVTENFAVGQSVRRSEDPILVRGEGNYTDDFHLDGQAYAFILRSPVAHGYIRGIDAEAARAIPGVLYIFTADELEAAGFGALKSRLAFKNRDGSPMKTPLRRALAQGKVRFVGDPVACIVAETLAIAKDAAEAVVLDIEPLPAVTSAAEAATPDAPQIFDDVPGNVQLDYHFGEAEKVAEAFANAAHVTCLSLINNRLIVNPMEPRVALASYDADSGFTLQVCSQGVVNVRNQLVNDILPEGGKVRVVTGNVGGSFGMKFAVYPEYVAILHAAQTIGRPVKWTDERATSFLSDQHGRDHEFLGELALDAEGRFLAVRLTGYANLGGYLTTVGSMMPTRNIVVNVIGQYRTPLIEVACKAMFTNTSPVGAYRGAGRPEANYYMERLIDVAAREMGIDRITLRRRNQIAPSEIPHHAPSGMVYDSGDFSALMDHALARADWDGFAARKRESEARGLLRGRGIGCFLEATAGPMPEMAALRFDADGGVTILTGTLDYGQGHATTFAQVLSTHLGIPFASIRLLQGDSNELAAGSGSGGSRSIMNSGAYILAAADEVVERGRKIAGHVLEAAVQDIEFSQGRFTIAGTDRSIGLFELAAKLRAGLVVPADLPQKLDAEHRGPGMPATFPNGCHICEVEIDPETGVTRVVKYVSVNDFGTIVNPLLVEGQLHGGIVQSIGQALMERTVYDEQGQLLSGSFLDYALPRADDLIDFSTENRPTLATTNPLGVKGCGEAGCAGGLTSVMNAVNDALADLGVHHIDMPATPLAVFKAIHAAKGAA